MSFWSKAKKAVSTAARVAKPYAPVAIPLLVSTPAALLAIKAVQKANAARAAQAQQAQQSQKVALLDAVPAKKDEDDEELMSMATSGLDVESLFRVMQPFISAAPGSVSNAMAVRREKRLAAQEARRKKLEAEAAMENADEEDVAGIGGPYADGWFHRWGLRGDDELGAPELAALRRFAGNPLAPVRLPPPSEVEGFVPNMVYRSAIVAQAKQLAKGGPVTTQHFAAAHGLVNRSMRARGLRIAIPGAAPGRRTL